MPSRTSGPSTTGSTTTPDIGLSLPGLQRNGRTALSSAEMNRTAASNAAPTTITGDRASGGSSRSSVSAGVSSSTTWRISRARSAWSGRTRTVCRPEARKSGTSEPGERCTSAGIPWSFSRAAHISASTPCDAHTTITGWPSGRALHGGGMGRAYRRGTRPEPDRVPRRRIPVLLTRAWYSSSPAARRKSGKSASPSTVRR